MPFARSELGSDPPSRVCVLDDYADFAHPENGLISKREGDWLHGEARAAFFRPMWASLCVAGAGLAPMEWNGRQINSPAIQSSIGAAGVLFGARSWVAWSRSPDGLGRGSLRSMYYTLMDCSGSTADEIKGMKVFANGYFCYQGPNDASGPPPPPVSARFSVASGGMPQAGGGGAVAVQ